MITYTIGRSKDNDIVIQKESVSTLHAKIHTNEHAIYIEDNNSTNGIFVNRRRVKQCRIYQSDEILIANVIFSLSRNFIIEENRIIRTKNIDDFSENFSSLVKIENDFENKIDLVNKQAMGYMIAFRISMLLTAVSGILIRMFVSGNNSKYILISTLVFGLFSLWAYLKADQNSKDKEKQKKILRDDFKNDYICPSCNTVIPDSIYLIKLKDEYRCKSCKAILYKKNK